MFYLENDNDYEKVEELLSTVLQIEISGEGDSMSREGKYNGETVYYSIWENAGGIVYCDKQVRREQILYLLIEI